MAQKQRPGSSALKTGSLSDDEITQKLQLNMPLGPPPSIPGIDTQLDKYLSVDWLKKLSIHDIDKSQKFWPRSPDPDKLLRTETSPVSTTIHAIRDRMTGELLMLKEKPLLNSGVTAKNSLSLNRAPGPLTESVRGNATNYPFLPGGLEKTDEPSLPSTDTADPCDFNDLFSVPAGFDKGMTFDKLSLQGKVSMRGKTADVSTLLSAWSSDESSDTDNDSVDGEQQTADKTVDDDNLDDLVPSVDYPVLQISQAIISEASRSLQSEWVEHVDISAPVRDFHTRIPDMAHKWPFELDVFQKQAILHLEQHDSVFVAAHTSAGKTVVAEYAIAMSKRHMTKTIYTSPIKALSNQKFRDFKTTFGDVGLLTGDVQINADASCVIMTTEILRSMLYNGSDVIRELEWVIFDEVHYINDEDRGVVWEETLIMLPQHVNIIMLSATVDNVFQFADWVGRTKKKKMYIISTEKRPVPLEHFLYTGNSRKSNNEMFLLVDSNSQFTTKAYYDAKKAKDERASKHSKQFGVKSTRGDPKQDKSVWLSLIDRLQTREQLPVVAFTFSRKKVDDNASMLTSVDLTTAKEKDDIRYFFQNTIQRLKGSDRRLPQVTLMRDLLFRGIGKHHSGILPILKEVLEMLFQKGLVKVLFATETFAMGVNMPARTVVFNSITKHDGTQFRELQPSEYIQMAGRAGRRGLDTTGTVIILCKGDVPELPDLHRMLMGKPTQLVSKFRLTYRMILNLLQVESIEVEDMMKRSFLESNTQKQTSALTERLHTLQTSVHIQHRSKLNCIMCDQDMDGYYKCCYQISQLRHQIMEYGIKSVNSGKVIHPGRVILLSIVSYSASLIPAMILHISRSNTLTVLALCNVGDASTLASSVTMTTAHDKYDVDPYSREIFQPRGACGWSIFEIDVGVLVRVTRRSLKAQFDKILDDHKKRQIPRFRDDPPGPSVSTTSQELLRLVEQGGDNLYSVDLVKEFHIKAIDWAEKANRLQNLQLTIQTFVCINCASFTEHFKIANQRNKIMNEISELEYKMSVESLQLHPKYQDMLKVLRELRYVDDNDTVQLKGRVACSISNRELLLTELVFNNLLTDLEPQEIAALLSCIVFTQRTNTEPELNASIKQAIDKILAVTTQIDSTQDKYKSSQASGFNKEEDDITENLNFGLAQVVYEWARGMPFAEITKLTDVQEGIIVRCIQRLDETCRDVRSAARIIGDPILQEKMEKTSSLIKRDIVFAASLYTQGL